MPKTTLDHLEERVMTASINLAQGLAAYADYQDVLPTGDISVEQTDDGVIVRFIEKPSKVKKTVKPAKEVDES